MLNLQFPRNDAVVLISAPWDVVRGALGLLLLGAVLSLSQAADRPPAAQSPADLTELNLEELMRLEVTSAGNKAQKLSNVAAALFVITPDDIRRSGVTSIPEALRLVPGLQVAHIDANKWAITARGFNDRFANKLLVLIDGRTVYS